jgi:hypothetical protein
MLRAENQPHVQQVCFNCLTYLCFLKVDFIDNLFLSKVQNHRVFFLVTKSFMGRRRGLPQNDRHRVIGMLED